MLTYGHPSSGVIMEFTIKSGNIEKLRSSCLVVGVHEGRHLTPAAQKLDKLSRNYITTVIKRDDFRGKTGQTLLLHKVPRTLCERILLVGCGPKKDLGDTAYQKIINRVTFVLNDAGVKEAVSCLAELDV
jgi:leucyl aminopeptidase